MTFYGFVACVRSQDGIPSNEFTSNEFEFTSHDDFVGLLLENGGTYHRERYVGKIYEDKYGNSFSLKLMENGWKKNALEYELFSVPDLDLLLPLRNYIESVWILHDSTTSDISFMENLPQLKDVAIDNQYVVNFEPLGKLINLEQLRIRNNLAVIDCSIFSNLNNLKLLTLSGSIINLETIFDKSKEVFRLPNLAYITIGEYVFDKWKDGYFLRIIQGLTPRDRNIREKYGNRYGEHYIDQYGNTFSGVYGGTVTAELLHTPDYEVLSSLSGNIGSLTIEDTSPITAIEFLDSFTPLASLTVKNSAIETFEPLKNLSGLHSLVIRNPNIKAVESLKRLSHLSSLKIDLSTTTDFLTMNGYGNVLDFLHSMKDIANLAKLTLSDSAVQNDDIEETDEMYSLAQEMFKISNLEDIQLDGNYFSRGCHKSYEFRQGKYHILQYRADVRTEPGRNGDVATILKLHDEVEIIENTFIEEKINDIWGFWYKIKYGNVIGYTFGGNIARDAYVTDIGKNGINDYFYFRFSANLGRHYIEPYKDVIIYINGQRINTNVLSKSERSLDGHFEWCRFEEHDDYVLVGLSQYGRHQYEYMHIFKVQSDGSIEYITDWNEIDYW
jgi:Leucine-rich repeat (LRR) protein